ncbi:MAG: 1,4-alpha-glucan branching protein GlgB [Deltaproteobacteria bacterium]|nr:1,4-alpha-glucan branching protein GlgB [Deltaproteobacteria bacterium]
MSPLGKWKTRVDALLAGELSRPHDLLGLHPSTRGGFRGVVVRAFHPKASAIECFLEKGKTYRMSRVAEPGLFAVFVPDARMPFDYRLRYRFSNRRSYTTIDPYRFSPTVTKRDLRLFSEGRHRHLWRILGSHQRIVDGVRGVGFAVWAPRAVRVSVLGDFCEWDGRIFPMRRLGNSGIFELFIPGLRPKELYKYEIKSPDGRIQLKADPFALSAEIPPRAASRITQSSYQWRDNEWMKKRRSVNPRRQPMAIYEVHLGSWARVPEQGNRSLGYREIADRIIAHVKRFNFTHLQLMPIAEHPFDGSWGYQITNYFSPTSRYGAPDDLRYLIDLCHRHDIGVILDWVPAHFPKDDFGLKLFDGAPLYEYEDPKLGEHPDWGTLIFDFSRRQVRNVLVANALYWLEEFHIDGLRIDAVASILYRDYSRAYNEWVPNKTGGRENLHGADFIREVNQAISATHPECFTIAEDSTTWPGVTESVAEGGLGFTFKWNMGWMHDTLNYLSRAPESRKCHQNDLTFALQYEYSEKFIMPLSHDEVVHGKGSLLHKMPGELWEKFANLRLLFAYQYTRPGKKLLFMGSELAPTVEWDHRSSLDWQLEDDPLHRGIALFLEDLGRIYRDYPCLWRRDHEPEGYEWIDHADHNASVLSYLRRDGDQQLIVVLNFSRVPQQSYRIGAPQAGRYRTLLCSDDCRYLGSTFQSELELESEPFSYHGRKHSLVLKLPTLAALILQPVSDPNVIKTPPVRSLRSQKSVN